MDFWFHMFSCFEYLSSSCASMFCSLNIASSCTPCTSPYPFCFCLLFFTLSTSSSSPTPRFRFGLRSDRTQTFWTSYSGPISTRLRPLDFVGLRSASWASFTSPTLLHRFPVSRTWDLTHRYSLPRLLLSQTPVSSGLRSIGPLDLIGIHPVLQSVLGPLLGLTPILLPPSDLQTLGTGVCEGTAHELRPSPIQPPASLT
jgi:hypothetical protein